jgi:hypothetical protein
MLSRCQGDHQGDVVRDGEGDQRDEACCPHSLDPEMGRVDKIQHTAESLLPMMSVQQVLPRLKFLRRKESIRDDKHKILELIVLILVERDDHCATLATLGNERPCWSLRPAQSHMEKCLLLFPHQETKVRLHEMLRSVFL